MVYRIIRGIAMFFLKVMMIFDGKKKKFVETRFYQDYNILQDKKYIWIHCASVGEINLSETLVREILKKYNERILITCITDTGMSIAKGKYLNNDRIDLLYFPLDEKKYIKKILKKIHIKMLILIETELWPNLIECVHEANGKIFMVNGRISDRSYSRYKVIRKLLAPILHKIDGFCMQSERDSMRIVEIGAEQDKTYTTGNIKFDIKFENFTEDEKEEYKKELGVSQRKIFVAGSTHTGENEIILNACKDLKDILLILVPRHPERVPDIEILIQNSGYSYKKFSEINKQNKEKYDIILVDAMGQLRKLYSICDVAFVGGTLTDIGGHSLLEPLYYGKTPIFGPYVQNVKDIARDISSKKLGYKVKDPKELNKTIIDILHSTEDKRKDIDDFFENNKNVVAKILTRLEK